MQPSAPPYDQVHQPNPDNLIIADYPPPTVDAQFVDNSEIFNLKKRHRLLQSAYDASEAELNACYAERAYYEKEIDKCQNENNQLKTQIERMSNAPSAGHMWSMDHHGGGPGGGPGSVVSGKNSGESIYTIGGKRRKRKSKRRSAKKSIKYKRRSTRKSKRRSKRCSKRK